MNITKLYLIISKSIKKKSNIVVQDSKKEVQDVFLQKQSQNLERR